MAEKSKKIVRNIYDSSGNVIAQQVTTRATGETTTHYVSSGGKSVEQQIYEAAPKGVSTTTITTSPTKGLTITTTPKPTLAGVSKPQAGAAATISKDLTTSPYYTPIPTITTQPQVAKPQTIIGRVTQPIIGAYEYVERKVKAEFTYPWAKVVRKAGYSAEDISRGFFGIQREEELPAWQRESALYQKFYKPIGEFEVGLGAEYLRAVKEEPIKIGVTTAAFFVLPKGLGIAGKGAAAIGAPSIYKGAVFATGAGLGVAYTGSIFKEIELAPTPRERGAVVGRRLATEIVPAAVGGLAGEAFWPRAETWFKPSGERLQLKEITPKKYYERAIVGEPGIPTAPVKTHLKMFTEMKYAPPKAEKPVGYHLTAAEFVKTKAPTGEPIIRIKTPEELRLTGLAVKEREAAALFVAPYPSIHFLRVAGKAEYIGGYELPPSPRGLIVEPTKFKVGFPKEPKPGVAYVPGPIIKKPEPQALVYPPTELGFTGKKYHFWYRGYKIGLEEVKPYKPSKELAIKPLKPAGKISRPSEYYVGPPIKYKLPKETYGLVPSYPKPSKPSKISAPYKPSYAPSIPYKPSAPYKPSIPYKPSVPYKPSIPYKPSAPYKPSIPYKPSAPYKPYKPTTYAPKKKPYKPTKGLGVLLPSMELKDITKIPQLKKQPRRYTPSLRAVEFKIKGKRPKRITGLELRPIEI